MEGDELPRTGPTVHDYDGVTAKRYDIDDDPPDILWSAKAPIAAFTAFLDHPEIWVAKLADAPGGTPLNVTLRTPFTMSICGLDGSPSASYVVIEGTSGTCAVNVRVSKMAVALALARYLKFSLEVEHGEFSELFANRLVIDETNFEQFYEAFTPAFLQTFTQSVSAVGLRDMKVLLDADNGRVYSHFQIADTLDYTTLAAYITSLSINGRAKQAYIMSHIGQRPFDMNGSVLANIVLFKGAPISPTPSPVSTGPFQITYTSDGINPDTACDMVVSTYVPDPVNGPYAIPDTSIIKDYV